MKLNDLVEELSLEVNTFKDGLDKEVSGAYVSDLLSDVMGNSKKGEVWITLQTHLNIVAVAGHADLAGVILVGGRKPQDAVIQKAETEKITILSTPLSAFEAAGKLYTILKK